MLLFMSYFRSILSRPPVNFNLGRASWHSQVFIISYLLHVCLSNLCTQYWYFYFISLLHLFNCCFCSYWVTHTHISGYGAYISLLQLKGYCEGKDWRLFSLYYLHIPDCSRTGWKLLIASGTTQILECK